MADLDFRLIITRVLDPDDLGAQIEPRMRNLGRAIETRARRLVPKRRLWLHDTITSDVSRVGSKVVATVGAGGGRVNYALFVERGTSRMAAQPYLRPALLQSTEGDLRR